MKKFLNIIVLIFYITIIDSVYANKPLTISNINNDEEAEELTNKTIFDIEDYIGNWADYKRGCNINKDLSFYCYGFSGYNCLMLNKTNNKIFMKCLSSYNGEEKTIYVLVELFYSKNIEKNVADLLIGIRSSLNIECFSGKNYSIIFEKCGNKYPYDNFFSGERTFNSLEELEKYNNIKNNIEYINGYK